MTAFPQEDTNSDFKGNQKLGNYPGTRSAFRPTGGQACPDQLPPQVSVTLVGLTTLGGPTGPRLPGLHAGPDRRQDAPTFSEGSPLLLTDPTLA